MGLVKGLAVASFQIVDYTKRRLCCSLNVIPRLEKCYLGNMTGMTFSSNVLPHTDVKALLILPAFYHPLSVFLQKLICAQRKAPSLSLAGTHTLTNTHRLALEYPTLHCSILPWQPFQK